MLWTRASSVSNVLMMATRMGTETTSTISQCEKFHQSVFDHRPAPRMYLIVCLFLFRCIKFVESESFENVRSYFQDHRRNTNMQKPMRERLTQLCHHQTLKTFQESFTQYLSATQRNPEDKISLMCDDFCPDRIQNTHIN